MSKFDNDKGFIPHEVFISYRRQEGWQLAVLVHQMLEAKGITAFYDRRDLDDLLCEDETWQEDIKYQIEHCEIFVPIISKKTLFYCGGRKDKHTKQWPKVDNMWAEWEIVEEFNKKCDPKDRIKIIPIIDSDYDIPEARPLAQGEDDTVVGVWGLTAKQKKQYKSYYENIVVKQNRMLTADSGFEDLKTYIDKIEAKILEKHPISKTNYDNPAYSHQDLEIDKKEAERLEGQTDDCADEIKEYLDEQLCSLDEVYAIDVGCATGYQTDRLFGQYSSIKYLLGVDNGKAYIKNANEKYARKTKQQEFEFIACDITKPEFETVLRNACNKNKHKFNLVFISLVLMHISTPVKVINLLADYMEEGGIIVIKDVDDDLNMSYVTSIYSEKANLTINQFNKIYSEVGDSGYRYIGRTIYGMLRPKFENIKIKLLYCDNCHLKTSESTAISQINFELESIKRQLNKPDLRISEYAKFKEYESWLNVKKDEIIQNLTNENYFSLFIDTLFIATRKK